MDNPSPKFFFGEPEYRKLFLLCELLKTPPAWKDLYPFHAACQGGQFEDAKKEASKWEVNFLSSLISFDSDGWKALHYAAWYNHKDIVSWILESGGAPSPTTKDNLSTPLHFAAGVGNLEIVKLLLEKGVNPQAISKEKQTPLALLEQLKPKNYEEIKGILKKGDL